MAMEKKSLVGKKTAPATKSKTTKSKVDTSKPAASKVVAARSGFKNPSIALRPRLQGSVSKAQQWAEAALSG